MARLRDPALDLVAGLEGSYALSAEQAFPVWGALAIDGPDARLVTAMEGPFGIEAWEQVLRQGMVTERPGSAGWGEPVGVTEATDVFRTAMGAMETVTLVVGACTVDWILAGRAEDAEGEAAFDAWWQSFRLDPARWAEPAS